MNARATVAGMSAISFALVLTLTVRVGTTIAQDAGSRDLHWPEIEDETVSTLSTALIGRAEALGMQLPSRMRGDEGGAAIQIVGGAPEAGWLSAGFLAVGRQSPLNPNRYFLTYRCSAVMIGSLRAATAAHCLCDGPGGDYDFFFGLNYANAVNRGAIFRVEDWAGHSCYPCISPGVQAAHDVGWMTLTTDDGFLGQWLLPGGPTPMESHAIGSLSSPGSDHHIVGYGRRSHAGGNDGERIGANWDVMYEAMGYIQGRPGNGEITNGDSGGPLYDVSATSTLGVAVATNYSVRPPLGGHASLSDYSEFMNVPGETACTNGMDDDDDGFIDNADADCAQGGNPCLDLSVDLGGTGTFEDEGSTARMSNDVLHRPGEDVVYEFAVEESGVYRFRLWGSPAGGLGWMGVYEPHLILTTECAGSVLIEEQATVGNPADFTWTLDAGDVVSIVVDGDAAPPPWGIPPAQVNGCSLETLPSGGSYTLWIEMLL